MRCPSCDQEIPIDLVEHIRTKCTGKAKKEDKQQLPLWPPSYISTDERSKNVQDNSSTKHVRTSRT